MEWQNINKTDFTVRAICTSDLFLACPFGFGTNLQLYKNQRVKISLGDDGLRIYSSKEKCWSYAYDISDLANNFRITGEVEENENI